MRSTARVRIEAAITEEGGLAASPRVREVPPKCRPPGGALVREHARRVEVEVIDDIAVGDGLEGEEIVDG